MADEEIQMSETADIPTPTFDKDKVTILPGASSDLSQATYSVKDEDHTLGNALRWMVMKDPDVEFCGYSLPHPSEAKFHIRIQMYDNKSSYTCLLKALDNLRNLLTAVAEKYNASLDSKTYEVVQDVDVNAEVRKVLEAKVASAGGADMEL